MTTEAGINSSPLHTPTNGAASQPLASLLPDPRNARRHTDRNLATITDALREVGAARSVVVDEHGIILAGNATVTAATAAGIERVRIVDADGSELIAVRRTGLTDEQKRRLALFDNRAAELAEWDPDILAGLAEDTNLADLWAEDELATLLAAVDTAVLVAPPAEPVLVPAPPTDPVTRRGDRWLLGEHVLVCGDATEPRDRERLLQGQRCDLLMTDPPYGIDAPRMTLGSGRKAFHRGDWDHQRIPIEQVLGLATHACIWGGNYYADVLPVTNHWLAWHKKNDGLSFSEFELAWTTYGKQTRLLSHHWSGEVKEHPTQKPVAVIAWAIDLAPQGATVLDPFGGSGSTLIACEQLGRHAWLMEIDPRYCDVIVRRWEGVTGGTARHEPANHIEPVDRIGGALPTGPEAGAA